jgi:hypothetical protein
VLVRLDLFLNFSFAQTCSLSTEDPVRTKNAGPLQLALGRLDAPKQAALLHDLEQLWIDNNLATNGENHTLISNEYLQALAMRRSVCYPNKTSLTYIRSSG